MDDDFLRDLEELGGGEEAEEEHEEEELEPRGPGANHHHPRGAPGRGEPVAGRDGGSQGADGQREGEAEGGGEGGAHWASGSGPLGQPDTTTLPTIQAQLASKVRAARDVRAIANLIPSRLYRETMEAIAHYSVTPRNPAQDTGAVEEDPEYQVMVNANNLVVDIDQEITTVHKFICDKYAPRFPELESLVMAPLDYARTVKAIGNEMDLTRVDLKSILPTATVMVITVTATTSEGKPIPLPEDLLRILEACDVVIELTSSRARILAYVESRMTFIAPNLSAIVGAGVSAKLMALAGGLTALSKIPACDLLVMGAQKRVNTGMSSVSQERHQGVIYGCDMIASIAPEYRRQAARMTAAKCALAARIDRARTARDGFHGRGFRLELEKKIDVLQAPNPGSKTRALPIPDEGPKKRRAGKRVRRAKEKLAVTELRKAQNRMSFGVPEEEVSIGTTGETIGLGMVSGSLSGKLRAAQADVRVKVGVSKKHKAFANHGSASTASGLSSVAFTPVQGIELHNPEAVKPKGTETSKYFGTSTFFQLPPAAPAFGAGLSRPSAPK